MPASVALLVLCGSGFIAAVALTRMHRDAVSLLSLYLALLLLLSARLVLPGMGGIGTPANVVALGLLVWWVGGVLAPALGTCRGSQPVRLTILAFAGWWVLSYALAFLRPLTELEVSGADRGLITVLGLTGVSLLAADGISSIDRLTMLLRRLVLLAVVVAIIGIVQFTLQYDLSQLLRPPGLVENFDFKSIIRRSNLPRPYSTALHPIEYSVVLAAVLPIALHFALHRRGRARLPWLAVGVLAVAAMMAVSRSGVLGAAIGVGILWLFWPARRKANVLVATALFLIAVHAAVPGLVGTLRSLFSGWGEDPSIQGRVDDVQVVRRLFADRPLLGYGRGTWSVEEDVLLDNEYYRTLLESGILGTFLLLLLPMMGVVCGLAVARRSPDPEAQHLGRALAASLIVLTVCMATFDALAFPMVTGLLFFLVGVAAAFWRLALADGDVSEPLRPSASASATPYLVGGRLNGSVH